MNNKDITQQVLRAHEEQVMQNFMEEVKDEFSEGVPISIKEEINTLLKLATESLPTYTNNVVEFKPKVTPKFTSNLGVTQLLAAAGQSLGDWFSQPMNFGGAGFILDVRRVIGSDDEVDLYLTPNNLDTVQMKKTLETYIGKSIHISVSNDGVQLLDANLYIDETGNAAEGSGTLVELDDTAVIKGSISIDIIVKE